MQRRATGKMHQRRENERQLARLHDRVGRRFGSHLRQLRERAGLSQAELAGERHDRSLVAKLESGASLPSLETLSDLAAALGVSRRALIPSDL